MDIMGYRRTRHTVRRTGFRRYELVSRNPDLSVTNATVRSFRSRRKAYLAFEKLLYPDALRVPDPFGRLQFRAADFDDWLAYVDRR